MATLRLYMTIEIASRANWSHPLVPTDLFQVHGITIRANTPLCVHGSMTCAARLPRRMVMEKMRARSLAELVLFAERIGRGGCRTARLGHNLA